MIDRFREEVRAAAKLRHPNRVRIFHFGESNGQPYYAMELIEGCNLAEKMKRPEGMSKEAALRYLASTAEAVAEAHERGILHRDLKPHNILIDEHTDEALLTDFGLAISETSQDYEAGTISGTFPYMAPEATHGTGAVGQASDVYGLGATLYHVLIGRPPVHGKSRSEMIEKIRKTPPTPLRQLRPDVPRKIERICLKSLQKEPKGRFSSAADFAAAIRTYLQRVDYGRQFTLGANLYMLASPSILGINLLTFALLDHRAWEPWIWLTIFSMYLPVFGVFSLLPVSGSAREHSQTLKEQCSIWGGKFIAAFCLSIAFRVVYWHQPYKAILLTFPVFAVMSGLALFATAAKMPRWCYGLSLGLCLSAVLMGCYLNVAPVIYGVVASVCSLTFGIFLHKLGRELS